MGLESAFPNIYCFDKIECKQTWHYVRCLNFTIRQCVDIVFSVTRKKIVCDNPKFRAWNKFRENRFFSEGGREVLIKAIIQAIPTYAMSCFIIPCSINNNIESMCARFWWGTNEKDKKIHWKNWSSLKRPKCDGGLGFRELTSFNKALLAKQVWRIMDNPNSLVARVLKARYFKHSDILEASLSSNPSYIWRSLMWSRDIIRNGTIWKVGNDASINARRDVWIPSLASGKITSNISYDSNVPVKELINDQEKWTWLELN